MEKYYMCLKNVSMTKDDTGIVRFSDAPFAFMQYGRNCMDRDAIEEAKSFFLNTIFKWMDFTPATRSDGSIEWQLAGDQDTPHTLCWGDRFVVDRDKDRIFIERGPKYDSQQVVYYGDPATCFRNYSQAFVSGIHSRLPAIVTAEDMAMYARGCPEEHPILWYMKEFEAYGDAVYRQGDNLWVYNRYDDKTAAEVALHKSMKSNRHVE